MNFDEANIDFDSTQKTNSEFVRGQTNFALLVTPGELMPGCKFPEFII
jgi:hypothetical protein